ncbi:hypothetical protein ZIOFF_051414 [Zingiber officinale]|uniref:Protein kinase domain-containing protein n=1 Tax=Zingiber officinale TaxID=94328 RepID=A0A8J5FRB3_ZINOF|nr:hypothetical protein ZIOFF_051414 [Zingiber officinale]
MAADLERGQFVVVVLFLCCSMILGLQSIAAERPLGSSTAQAGSNRSDCMEDDKPPLLGRLVNSLPKNGSHSHAWPELELGWRVVLGSTITFAGSALGSVGGVGGGGIFVPIGGPYVASHSAGNDGAYLSANTPSKGAQTIKPQPIAVPAILVDEIREITKKFGDEALIWEGSVGRVYFGVLKNERSTAVKKLDSSKQQDQEFLAQVSMVSRLKHENVMELVGYSVEGNLRLLAYEFATMGSLHDILHELDALLHEMGIANKDSNTAQNETADKKQLEQSSEGEKKESVGAPSENKILKKKKSKKEKSSKEQEEHDQK